MTNIVHQMLATEINCITFNTSKTPMQLMSLDVT
jgi:hypothetical protein